MMTNGPAASIGEVMEIPFASARSHSNYGRSAILQAAELRIDFLTTACHDVLGECGEKLLLWQGRQFFYS